MDKDEIMVRAEFGTNLYLFGRIKACLRLLFTDRINIGLSEKDFQLIKAQYYKNRFGIEAKEGK